jgi:hypothetical protein
MDMKAVGVHWALRALVALAGVPMQQQQAQAVLAAFPAAVQAAVVHP